MSDEEKAMTEIGETGNKEKLARLLSGTVLTFFTQMLVNKAVDRTFDTFKAHRALKRIIARK